MLIVLICFRGFIALLAFVIACGFVLTVALVYVGLCGLIGV